MAGERMVSSRIVGSGLILLALSIAASGQTWTPVKHVPNFVVGANTELLMTDGTVLIQDAYTDNWWKLTPDLTGSYVNGSWTQLPSTPTYGPTYLATQVLPDGRVFTMGGEYNFGNGVWQNTGYIYNPVSNTWTFQSAPSGWSQMGDTASVVLANGQVMLADPLSSQDALFNPATNTFQVPYGTGKADYNDEEALTLLPNGNVLTVDCWDIPNTEIFNVATQTWSSAGKTPVALADASSAEIGPAVVRPDGTVIQFGATGHNAVFNSLTGSWATAPDFPKYNSLQLLCEDAPAVLLTSGNVLVQAGTPDYGSPSIFFEWNGSTLKQVPAPASAAYDPCFVGEFLMLPNGQVLWTSQSDDVEVYTSSGQPNSSWAPTITSYPTTVKEGLSYGISGTQFNGLSGCSAFGDDLQDETNYPLIRITNSATGNVYYCREYNPSTMAICTGSQTVSTHFTVPVNSGLLGKGTIQVVTNGIASAPMPIAVYPPVSAYAVSVFEGTNGQGTVQNVWVIDGQVYSCRSISGVSNGYSGQEAGIEADFNFSSASSLNKLTVQASASAATGATGMLYLYNWTTAAWDYLGDAGLSTSQTNFSAASTKPASEYVSSSGEVRALVRALVPSHVSNSPFTLAADLIQVATQ